MKKKIFSIALILFLLISLIPINTLNVKAEGGAERGLNNDKLQASHIVPMYGNGHISGNVSKFTETTSLYRGFYYPREWGNGGDRRLSDMVDQNDQEYSHEDFVVPQYNENFDFKSRDRNYLSTGSQNVYISAQGYKKKGDPNKILWVIHAKSKVGFNGSDYQNMYLQFGLSQGLKINPTSVKIFGRTKTSGLGDAEYSDSASLTYYSVDHYSGKEVNEKRVDIYSGIKGAMPIGTDVFYVIESEIDRSQQNIQRYGIRARVTASDHNFFFTNFQYPNDYNKMMVDGNNPERKGHKSVLATATISAQPKQLEDLREVGSKAFENPDVAEKNTYSEKKISKDNKNLEGKFIDGQENIEVNEKNTTVNLKSDKELPISFAEKSTVKSVIEYPDSYLSKRVTDIDGKPEEFYIDLRMQGKDVLKKYGSNFIFVVDKSRSMEETYSGSDKIKMNVLKNQLKNIIDSLTKENNLQNTSDPKNNNIALVDFSTYAWMWNGGSKHIGDTVFSPSGEEAKNYVDSIQPNGSTNYNETFMLVDRLLSTLPTPREYDKRNTYVVFLTDGEPTVSYKVERLWKNGDNYYPVTSYEMPDDVVVGKTFKKSVQDGFALKNIASRSMLDSMGNDFTRSNNNDGDGANFENILSYNQAIRVKSGKVHAFTLFGKYGYDNKTLVDASNSWAMGNISYDSFQFVRQKVYNPKTQKTYYVENNKVKEDTDSTNPIGIAPGAYVPILSPQKEFYAHVGASGAVDTDRNGLNYDNNDYFVKGTLANRNKDDQISTNGEATKAQIALLRNKWRAVNFIAGATRVGRDYENNVMRHILRDYFVSKPENYFEINSDLDENVFRNIINETKLKSVNVAKIEDPLSDDVIMMRGEGNLRKASDENLSDGDYYVTASGDGVKETLNVTYDAQANKLNASTFNLGEYDWLNIRYKIKLNKNRPNVAAGKYVLANKQTTMKTKSPTDGGRNLGREVTRYFALPAVRTEKNLGFSVQKVNSDNTPISDERVLQGTSFELKDPSIAENNTNTATYTAENKSLSFTNLKENKVYELKEVTPPNGYVKEEKLFEVKIVQNGNKSKVDYREKGQQNWTSGEETTGLPVIKIVNKLKTNLSIIKVNTNNQNIDNSKLARLKFSLKDTSNNSVVEKTFDGQNNNLIFENLLVDKVYELRELEAPVGYNLENRVMEVKIVLKESGTKKVVQKRFKSEQETQWQEEEGVNLSDIALLKFQNSQGKNIKVIKQDATSENRLSGGKFKVYRQDNNGKETIKDEKGKDVKVVSVGNEFTIENASDGNHEHNIKVQEDGTYYLIELQAPSGYIKKENAIGKVVLSQESGNIVELIGKNYKKSILPYTGGIGVPMFVILGGLLILLSYALKKRNEYIK